MSEGGKRTCKYYKACGNTENCKRCTSYEKEKKTARNSSLRKEKSNNH